MVEMSIFRMDAPTWEEILAVAPSGGDLADFRPRGIAQLLAAERQNTWGGGD
jgi:hypothetical protein